VIGAQEGSLNSDWVFWGILRRTFVGYGSVCDFWSNVNPIHNRGWTTSAKLRNGLIYYVARELNTTYKAAASNPLVFSPPPEAIDAAIKRAFVRLHNDIVHDKVMKVNSRRFAAELLSPALSSPRLL
jgi:pyruvate dehydrogenase phosphatase